MDYLTFFFAILHVHQALCGKIFWDTTVRLEETLTLECAYPSVGSLTQMEWFKINGKQRESIVVFHPTYGVNIRKDYADRVYFPNSTVHGYLTLTFYNTSKADLGFYSCVLHIFPYGIWDKTIQVVQADSFEAAVPSGRHVVSEPGQNVTLTFQLQMKWPVSQVIWEKVQPHQIDILTRCNLSHGKTYTSKYERETWSNCSQGSELSLLLIPHATAFDSGLYRCRVEASTGENETFTVTLTVTDGKTDNQHVLFVAGGTVSLLFIILIIIIIVISYNRRRRRQTNVPVKQSWCKQSKAVNNYRNPILHNEGEDNTREDVYVNYPTFPQRPRPRV